MKPLRVAVVTVTVVAILAGYARHRIHLAQQSSPRLADVNQPARDGAGRLPMVASLAAYHRANPPTAERIVAVAEASPGLLADAQLVPVDAQHLAETKYPKGEVLGATIERRGSDLVYAYRFKPAGSDGEEVVLVNALDGTIMNTLHQASTAAKVSKRRR